MRTLRVPDSQTALLFARCSFAALERMMRYGAFLFVSTVAALISCSQDRASPANRSVDEAVIAVVLEDFANWKQATFGELEGVLELEPDSEANPNATAQEVRSLAPEIQNRWTTMSWMRLLSATDRRRL